MIRSLSTLPGRCTENPKGGRGGAACTAATAVVGGGAVRVEAALFGCWVVVWVALQGWGRVFLLVCVCGCVCSCWVCVCACDVSVVCVVVWFVACSLCLCGVVRCEWNVCLCGVCTVTRSLHLSAIGGWVVSLCAS